MDLNLERSRLSRFLRCWLPRGAMDLNGTSVQAEDRVHRWLPRGAMDLNLRAECRLTANIVGSLVEPWILILMRQ